MSCAALTGFAVHSSNDPVATTTAYTAAKQYDAMAWIRGGERFPQGAAIVIHQDGKSHKLVPDFAASADPNVSFDGKLVLFSGKKTAQDPWQIWEVAIEGGTPRRVLYSKEDAVRPMYLPEERMVFARKRNGRFVIEAVSTSAGQALPLFYAAGSALPTDVLRDGRVLFQATYPLGSGTTPELYTVYSDGSGVESYRCDHGKARYAGRQVASGDIVFTRGSGLGRFTSPLAHDVDITAPAGEYTGDVADTGKGEWLLSYRADATKPFELKNWKPGSPALTQFASEAGMNLVQAVVAAQRVTPNRHPSGLHANWNYANLLTLNAYASKSRIAAGSIAKVRLYTQDADGKTVDLGTAPVEKDGSLYIKVPGDRPLKLELIDANGKTIQKESGWWYARSGEQRICVGCHTGPERAPDNAVPAVLVRTIVPVDLTGTSTSKETSHTGGN
jgi:hypothetical protein